MAASASASAGDRIRVVIIDDSAVVRRMIRSALEADPDLAVVAEAGDGREGIARIRESHPDAVVCDVEMPVMSGIATVEELRLHWPRLPVIMFAAPTREGAHITLEALHAGASDFVAKPSAVGGGDLASTLDKLRVDLGGKLKGLVHGRGDISAVARAALRYAPRPTPPPAATPTPLPTPMAPSAPTPSATPLSQPALPPSPTPLSQPALPPSPTPLSQPALRPTPRPVRPRPAPRPGAQAAFRPARCEAVVIAVSTGGPNALGEVLPRLPRDLPVPVLVVQHMPAVFTRLLAERLAATSAMPVAEAGQGDEVQPGRILIAPGDQHLTVVRDGAAVRCHLIQDPPENSVRPSADVLMRSAAEVWGGGVLAVVMTGMGQDGLLGAMQLHHRGATVLVQDEASSVVWGMPGAVARAGIADDHVPLARLAEAVTARARGR